MANKSAAKVYIETARSESFEEVMDALRHYGYSRVLESKKLTEYSKKCI